MKTQCNKNGVIDLYLYCSNEQNTLSKMGVVDPAARLSCQIQIDEHLKNAVVEFFDNV